MRKPLNQFYTPQRDPRKHILFVGDIFDSKFSSVLNPIKELLKTDYYCMSNIKHRDVSCMVRMLERTYDSSNLLRPDLIVAYGSGATLAAQAGGVEKVLIRPFYRTGKMLEGMLGKKCQKTRIQLPVLGQPEYLVITPTVVMDWKSLETQAMQYGYNSGAHSLFLASDIDTEHYKEHVQQHGSALIVPGENILDPVAIDGIVKVIRGILETDV